jgi:serine/threonine protein kinase
LSIVSCDEYVLSRYELGRTLGDGNFAIVRQAKLKNSNSEYAMKVIDKPKLKGKEHMVENEIEIMKDCHQPNIVKLYEEYETIDKIYLVMELVKATFSFCLSFSGSPFSLVFSAFSCSAFSAAACLSLAACSACSLLCLKLNNKINYSLWGKLK